MVNIVVSETENIHNTNKNKDVSSLQLLESRELSGEGLKSGWSDGRIGRTCDFSHKKIGWN